jgi:DNA polymerase-3 subunit gamma/tau
LGGTDSAGLRRLWPDVLDQVRARSRRTRALLDNASVGSVDGTRIRLAATSSAIAKMIADDSNLGVLREALAAVVGGGWQIEVGLDSGGPAVAEAAPTEAPRAPAVTGGRAAARSAAAEAGAPTGSASAGRSGAAPNGAPHRDESEDVDEETDEVHSSERSGGDAEAVAMALLQNSLGARPIEQP